MTNILSSILGPIKKRIYAREISKLERRLTQLRNTLHNSAYSAEEESIIKRLAEIDQKLGLLTEKKFRPGEDEGLKIKPEKGRLSGIYK